MNKVVITLLLALASLAGFFIGKLIDWPFFSIEKSINLVDVSSIIITSLIAYYVVGVIEKKGTENRHEKDLILKRIDEIGNLLQECSVEMSDGEIAYTEASAYFGKATILVNRAFNMLTIASIDCNLNFQTDLHSLIRSLRNLSTNTPRTLSPTPELTVVNGVIKISSNRLYEIEQKFEEIRNTIFTLQVALNRA